jgi:ligand-binding SRPBCC domain-containing protein
VTWEGRHFGVRQRLTSRITAFDRPRYFQDSMMKGAFASFVHDHFFEAAEGGTTMKDLVVFRSPLGPLGSIADRLVLTRYLTRLLSARNLVLKRAAEGPAPSGE